MKIKPHLTGKINGLANLDLGLIVHGNSHTTRPVEQALNSTRKCLFVAALITITRK